MSVKLYVLALAAGALAIVAVGGATVTAAGAAASQNYLVVYKSSNVPPGAAKSIQRAGGAIAYSYDQIGVVVATSSSTSFASNLRKAEAAVEGASATAGFATRLDTSE